MYNVPYSIETFRPIDEIVPGNSTAEHPCEFDLVPPWGPDLARLKSILVASSGLVEDGEWTPALQDAVIKAFETGAHVFGNTVTAIRGLRIPARMALRAGIIHVIPPGGDLDTPVPVMNGQQFSQICGAISPLALHVAFALLALSRKQDLDARFFAQPSGSGGAGTLAATATTAGNARRPSRRRVTAVSEAQTGGPLTGTSSPSSSS